MVFKLLKNKRHAISVRLFATVLINILSDEWSVRSQDPITLNDSEPEPDLVVASSAQESSAAFHPTANDIALLVEVADSSLAFDRGRKLRIYARAGIACYWIVNLIDDQLECYTKPQGDVYLERRDLTLVDIVNLPAEIGGASIDVENLFPPK